MLFWLAFCALAYLRREGHPFESAVEAIVLVVAGGPYVEGIVTRLMQVWKR